MTVNDYTSVSSQAYWLQNDLLRSQRVIISLLYPTFFASSSLIQKFIKMHTSSINYFGTEQYDKIDQKLHTGCHRYPAALIAVKLYGLINTLI